MDERDDIFILDGHSYRLLEEGIYEARPPYGIDTHQWMFDERHVGYQAIILSSLNGDDTKIQYISTDGTGGLRLIQIFNNLLKEGNPVKYIEGAPNDNAMGEVYA